MSVASDTNEGDVGHYSVDFHDIRTLLPMFWWRKKAYLQTLAFVICAFAITGWRLLFGCINIVYLIHSIVILLDLLLATIFSRSLLFNLSLNLVAILCAMLYKCFRVVVIELVETTTMAFLASIYALLLKYRHRKQIEEIGGHEHDWYQVHMYLQERLGITAKEFIVEEFLDGAAGIMYTSFFGLVISEFALLLGQDDYIYCIWSDHYLTCPV